MAHAIALRLSPNADLRRSLMAVASDRALSAAYVATCVGSLSQATLRFAGQSNATVLKERFEIISLVGTVSGAGVHLHIGLADSTGRCLGGHVLDGCLIYTTAEIILGTLSDVRFDRTLDPATGYRELEIIAIGGHP
ncbi:MAG: DNA-binding protein [Synechococcales cyanobacterium T60_A2020_003]|nr:DNA-binding protein [Synechococcales cyanobacterium T60_A2020_003]